MDHEEATRLQACSRYITGDLSAADTSAFEDHYFGCSLCSEELVTVSMFAENVRAVFHERAQSLTVPIDSTASPQTGVDRLERGKSKFWASCAMPVATAACVLLAVVLYQNAVVIPGMKTEVAALSKPRYLNPVALKLARENSAVRVERGEFFWQPYFMLAQEDGSRHYTCNIETATGLPVENVEFPPPQTGQPTTLLLRRSRYANGGYVFKVYGDKSAEPLATYTIELKD